MVGNHSVVACAHLLFYGHLSRFNHITSTAHDARHQPCAELRSDLHLWTRHVLPALRDRVLLPAALGFRTLSISGHTWLRAVREGSNCTSCWMPSGGRGEECAYTGTAAHLEALLRQQLAVIRNPKVMLHRFVAEDPSIGRYSSDLLTNRSAQQRVQAADRLPESSFLNALASVTRGLDLLPEHAVSAQELVVLMRWDVVFFSEYHLTALNPQLFYRANCACGHLNMRHFLFGFP